MATTKNVIPSLTKEKQVELLEKMLVIRNFEEASIKSYQKKKIAGFLHTYIGQEAVGVGTLAHKLPQDSVVTTYRCHGLYLVLGGSPRGRHGRIVRKGHRLRARQGRLHAFLLQGP